MREAAFYIGELPVYGDLILSPMDGYSDYPYRSIAREMGSALSYTEFINCLEVLQGHPFVHEKFFFKEAERPLVYQIFDDDPQRIVETARVLVQKKPDILDVNMGCSNKSVAGRGAGAGLLQEPQKIQQIFSLLSKEFQIPITGKIRLGWDKNNLNYLEIARIIEDNGGKMIAVHGRTKEQAYSGKANWEPIRQIKNIVKIPVIGNGDVKTPADIKAMKEQTGCDGVMIGRAAMGNPWIFARKERNEIKKEEVFKIMHEHLQRMLEYYGAERGIILFRKHLSRYLKPYEFKRDTMLSLLTCTSFQELLEILQGLLLQ